MNMIRKAAVLTAAAAMLPSQAHAEILTFVVPYSTISVLMPQFDPALGTLNSAKLTLDGHLEYPFEILSSTSASGTYSYSSFYSLYYFDKFLDVGVSGSGPVDFGAGSPLYLGADGLGSHFIAADRLAFTIGTGTFSGHIQVDPPWQLSATGGNIMPDRDAPFYVSGTVTVEYDYTAVPEPASWLMMLLGTGLAGFGLRRRRQPRASFAV